MSIAHSIAHQPRSKVPRQVDSIPSIPPEASPKSEDQEEQREWEPAPRSTELALIAIILQRKDDKHEDGAGDELAEELARFRQVGLRVRAKDGGGGCLGRRDGAEVGAAFVGVDAVDVVGVDDAGRAEPAEQLCEEVDGKAAPGEFAKETVGEGDGRAVEQCQQCASSVFAVRSCWPRMHRRYIVMIAVSRFVRLGYCKQTIHSRTDSLEICSTITRHIDAQHDPQAPAPTDTLIVPKPIHTWRRRRLQRSTM